MTDQTEATQATEVNKPDSIIRLDAERQISTNFFWRKEVEGQTFDLQTTVRDQPSEAEVLNHMEAVGMAMRAVMTRGGIAKNVGNAPQMQTVVTAPAPTPAPAAQAPVVAVAEAPAAPAPSPVPAPSGPLSFAAVKLSVSITGGKKYFKIIGPPPFHKYGVKIWDEVLSPYFDINAMEAMEYEIPGFVATYIMKDGKADKVIKLEKSG